MDIHTIDLEFQGIPHAIAAYLVVGPGGPVLIETGPASTLDILRARLAELGYEVADIEHVIVTHIHLDHSGAAGWWAQQGAQVYVHHVGAPHIADPSRLLRSAGRLYGDDMDRLWGQTVAAPADRVTELRDGDLVEACGLTFRAIDTPGHASHHHVIRLEDVGFTGDAGGVRILGSELIDIPAVPPEFDREAWYASLSRLQEERFAAIFPTHFGRVDDVNDHLERVRALIGESSGFVLGAMMSGAERDELVEHYTTWNLARAHESGASSENIGQAGTANPLAMSVDGISRYWRKKQERAEAG
ncbi:MAG: MBL fold metallo-hydrolase [Anaerolineae bacterium]